MCTRLAVLLLAAVSLLAACTRPPHEELTDEATIRPNAPAGIATFDPAQGTFFLRSNVVSGEAERTVTFGLPGDVGIAGDWDGDGLDTVGVYRPSNNTFYLVNRLDAPNADFVVSVRAAGDLSSVIPLVGDWDGNGTVTPALYRSSDATLFARNGRGSGPPDLVLTVGSPGDLPLAGDWEGDGITTLAVYRPREAAFYLPGDGDPVAIPFGIPGDLPVAGDWDGDGVTTIGVFRPSAATFFLRRENAPGESDLTATFGLPHHQPLAGRWGL